MKGTPIVRDLCLIGGGHSHTLLIRQWAMKPLLGVRLTLVSNDAMTPYSGMLPGLISGHYALNDIHIDLRKLCAWAGVRFIEKTMNSLDLNARKVQFSGHPALTFDLISLDTGSTPNLSVEGAQEHSTPVKPVHDFYARWQHILSRLKADESSSTRIGVVGSGAGGFELVTAMRHALPEKSAHCFWFVRGSAPLKGRSEKVGQLAIEAARRIGVTVVTDADIQQVEKNRLLTSDGRSFNLDEILWCTGAVGPNWAAESGLDLDSRGFVSTNVHLQSCSHPFVFATGDIGTQRETPSAKAGVFAVRQAPVLFQNLRRFLLKQPLKRYVPQQNFLTLMATGEKRAIASRGMFALEANWIWRWKDYIDRKFMEQFKELPLGMVNSNLDRLPDALREPSPDVAQADAMRCKGCGAKVSSRVLDRVIDSLNIIQRDDVLHGLSTAADTATVRVPSGVLVQSVDQIDAIVDDAYLLGRIAALHALSDVVTVDAVPHSAQVLVTLPSATEAILERDLQWLMFGLVEALNEEGCALIGGHTTQGDELSVGVVVNALLNNPTDESKSMAQCVDGDVLILTQAIGIGTLFAGLMQSQAYGRDISAALEDMTHSNRIASEVMREHGAVAMTDVTGFGLLGHLERMLRGASRSHGAQVQLATVPMMRGALDLAIKGVRSTLWPANSRVLSQVILPEPVDTTRLALLCDPQTSGGLLALVPQRQGELCIQELKKKGYADASIIGVVDSSTEISVVP